MNRRVTKECAGDACHVRRNFNQTWRARDSSTRSAQTVTGLVAVPSNVDSVAFVGKDNGPGEDTVEMWDPLCSLRR